MALFPPELVAGVLVAFVQVRLRSFFSLASWFLNGLSFLLPPDEAVINQINGGPPHKKDRQPLTIVERMSVFYVKVTQTEHGVFQHTPFYELYEMLMILLTSSLVVCLSSEMLVVIREWSGLVSYESTISQSLTAYGLLSTLLVSLWFPLSIQFAQGFATYEARLGIAVGALACILAGFMIISPPNLFDFNVENAVDSVGQRIALVLRVLGFQDGDMVRVAVIGEILRTLVLIGLAGHAGVFVGSSFLGALRFSKMYLEMTQDSTVSIGTKILLHLHVILPLICGMCWIKPLATDLIVPSSMTVCAPLEVRRDCLMTGVQSKGWGTTESHWHTIRLYIVLVTILVRLLVFRCHIQRFLLEPRASLGRILQQPGLVDGELLQHTVRLPFNYVPILVMQYLTPVIALLSAAVLLMRQTAISLHVIDLIQWILRQSGLIDQQQPRAIWKNPENIGPDLNGFRLGDEITLSSMKPLMKAMNQFVLVTPSSYASFVGFLVAWLSLSWFFMTFVGIIYWKNIPHTGQSAIPTPVKHVQAPKRLKEQRKAMKMKKRH